MMHGIRVITVQTDGVDWDFQSSAVCVFFCIKFINCAAFVNVETNGNTQQVRPLKLH
jgi:hypothetical protein